MDAAIAPETIVAAMAKLDEEVAVLGERRRLLQQLLATYDDEHGDTIQPQPQQPAPSSAKQAEARPVPHRVTNGGYTKWDYREVAAVINDANARGVSVGRTLVERFGVTLANAQKMVKQARKLGLVASSDTPLVPAPIARMSFDAQAARDAAAGPATGPVQSFGLGTLKRERPKPEPEPRFGVDDALAALEAS